MSTLRAKLQSTVSMPRRLARDERGNVIWIMAFALIPLIGLVGAGIDMTRAYMANTRLQAACDSGVLAGRKDMAGVNYTTENQQTALDHFTVNYGPNEFRSSNVSFTTERLPSGEVTGQATASMPTAIMHIMGRDTIDLSATCGARMDLTNADIMFVLDTTPSMTEMAGADTRIMGLRKAVKSFAKVMADSTNDDTTVRYGFVPYSSSVNVGHLLKPEWIADRWTYQSRRVGREVIDTSKITSTSRSKWTPIAGTREAIPPKLLAPESCIAPPNTMTWKETPGRTEYEDIPGGGILTVYYFTTESNGSTFTITRKDGNCYLNEERRKGYTEEAIRTSRDRTPEEARRVTWNYEPITYDVSSVTQPGDTITAPIDTLGANRTIAWNGCIEERRTTKSPISLTGEISPAALDLDIGLVPDGRPATQWGPAFGSLVYGRGWGKGSAPPDDANDAKWIMAPAMDSWSEFANVGDYTNDPTGVVRNVVAGCPNRAQKLEEMTEAAVGDYVDDLTLQGYTHPDIGLLWGARLIWPTGLFAEDNNKAEGGPVSRNIIFMTDGATETEKYEYDAYGFSVLDRRRTSDARVPQDNEQNALVDARMGALCDAIKNRGVTIWVVAFGTDLTRDLRRCASTDRAFKADNAVELNTTFQDIAAKIGNLRVTR